MKDNKTNKQYCEICNRSGELYYDEVCGIYVCRSCLLDLYDFCDFCNKLVFVGELFLTPDNQVICKKCLEKHKDKFEIDKIKTYLYLG